MSELSRFLFFLLVTPKPPWLSIVLYLSRLAAPLRPATLDASFIIGSPV